MNHNQRNEFFLTFFDKIEGNESKEINGFILFKHWDGNKKKWTVSLFTKESFKNMQNGWEKTKKLF